MFGRPMKPSDKLVLAQNEGFHDEMVVEAITKESKVNSGCRTLSMH